MVQDWFFPLDMLASNRVIDFDAPAFILDQEPRYIGNPTHEQIMDYNNLLPKGTKIKDQPIKDVYSNDDNSYIQNPNWKKLLALGTFIVGAGIIGFKILTKKKPPVANTNISNNVAQNSIKSSEQDSAANSQIFNSAKTFLDKIKDFGNDVLLKVKNMFAKNNNNANQTT